MNTTVAVLEGDGIGPEITREGLKVLAAIGETYGHTITCETVPFGASAYFNHGTAFPERSRLP